MNMARIGASIQRVSMLFSYSTLALVLNPSRFTVNQNWHIVLFLVAALTWVVYDFLLSFGEEVFPSLFMRDQLTRLCIQISLVWNRWYAQQIRVVISAHNNRRHHRHGQHARRLYILIRYFSVINLWYGLTIQLSIHTSLMIFTYSCYVAGEHPKLKYIWNAH